MKDELVQIDGVRQRLDPSNSKNWNPCNQAVGASACAVSENSIIAYEPLPKLAFHDLRGLLDRLLRVSTGGNGYTGLGEVEERRRLSSRGVRFVLASDEGVGYSEFFRPSDYFYVSITSAAYARDTWINVEGDNFFTLRVLFSGALLSEAGAAIVRAPQASLYISGGRRQTGFYISAADPLSMVVLHCTPALLTQVLGLDPGEVPAPLDSLFTQGHFDQSLNLDPFSDVIQTAKCIIESQERMLLPLRRRYREVLCLQLMMHLIKELHSRGASEAVSPLSGRDVTRVNQARDYLSRNFVKPPTISVLARRVGVSQTKLKVGFRELTHATIYEFILKSRMEMAASLLRSGDYRVADVAYKVGYEYPANFTHAFKKHYGTLPRAFIRRPSGKLASPKATA